MQSLSQSRSPLVRRQSRQANDGSPWHKGENLLGPARTAPIAPSLSVLGRLPERTGRLPGGAAEGRGEGGRTLEAGLPGNLLDRGPAPGQPVPRALDPPFSHELRRGTARRC